MAHDTHRLWVDEMPEAYERWLAPVVFRPFAVDMARRVAAATPRRVLELAAGTGVLTRELVAATTAEVTATDLNEPMVEVGRRQVPGPVWRRADAADLPFDDAQYDLVVCQFGAMFFPDKEAAFGEARRVLEPQGQFVVSTWAALDTHDFQAALVAGLERAFPNDPPSFMASVVHGCADVDIVVGHLRRGGFGCVSVESVTLAGHATSAADVAKGYCTGTPLRAEIHARGDIAAATAVVAEEMEARLGAGEVNGTMTANIFLATPSA